MNIIYFDIAISILLNEKVQDWLQFLLKKYSGKD